MKIHTGHKRPRNRKIKLYISYLNLLINIFVITTLFVNINGTESDESSTSVDDEEPVFSQSAQHLFKNENSNEDGEKHPNLEASSPSKNHRQHRKNPPPSVLADVQLSCAEGWERFEGKCYKLISIEKSWPQALAFCSRFGAKLVRLESSEENKFLAKYLMRPHLTSGPTTSPSEYWIGLLYRPLMMDSSISSSSSHSKSLTDGSFLWSDGSQTSRYVGFWSYGQPDPANGSCTKILVDGLQVEGPTWQLDVCNQLRPFICEQNACIKGSFFCQNGVCLPERAHCNGIDECGDSSDEFNCPSAHSEMSCQRYEKGESGRIETPNFPASYRQGSNCRWVIEGPLNSKIQLNFDSFETEERHDLVTVLDGGPSENSTFALSTISGTPRNTEKLSFESSTNRMIVQFRADQSIQARGFQASWRTVPISCGNQLLKASSIGQQFHSPEWPRNYPKGLECVWRIEAPSGQLISLFIDEFNTEAETDFLTIYDGPSPSEPILAKFSGQMKEPQLIISTQSQVHIYFFSSETVSQKGFTITYKKGCDNSIRRSHGVLTSPGNAHLPYAPSQICRWSIELPSQQIENFEVAAEIPSLSLVLNSWDVADLGDKLQIYEGGEDGSSNGRPLHESDGFTVNNAPPKTIYAKQGRVELVWRSNVLNSGTGWNISFSTSCPPLSLPSRRVLLSTKNTAYGTHVTISCERGFEFSTGLGRHFETGCELGGLWSNYAPVPDCQPVYCSAIPQIANGFAVSATNVSYAGMARYQCYEGFSFASGKQHEEIFCTDEGRWTQSPKCKTDACPALPSFVSGERILQFGDGIGFGSVFQFHCAKGYFIEGPLSIVCRPNGEWSSPQPLCKKLTCTDIPIVENGELHLLPSNNMVTDEKSNKDKKLKDQTKNFGSKQKMEFKTKRSMVIRELQFGDSLRVECHSGFQSVGAETLKCLANQTLSGIPKCRDIDECELQSAGNCATKSTTCVNMPGGFHCQCQPGYKPKLDCSGPLTVIPARIQTSHGVPIPVQQLNSKNGWCADSAITNAQMLEKRIMPFNESITSSSPSTILTLIFTFPVPKIIEKLHLEKVVVPNAVAPSGIAGAIAATPEAWPQRFTLSYSIEEGMPFEVYNGGLAELGGNNNITSTNENKKSNERKLNTPNTKEIRTRALGII
uniref:Uncharacterized protein n=1 Tax=Meloidogyne enterolobii TaxID=390850 RepID=A0A6V7WNT7_MELEN|nr:unnamed protein product [Meloidogyne enterolobii]